MKVSTSPDFLQSVIDKVWKWVARDDESPEQTRQLLEQLWDRCIGLEWPEGGFLLIPKGPGTYEIHTLFLPVVKDPVACGNEAAEYVFCLTDCTRVVTQVPADNIAADRLTRKMGFTLERIEPAAFLRNGIHHDVKHYALTKDGWLRSRECLSQAV